MNYSPFQMTLILRNIRMYNLPLIEYIYTKQEPDDIPKPDFDIEYDNWYDSDTTAEEEGLLDEPEPNNDEPF